MKLIGGMGNKKGWESGGIRMEERNPSSILKKGF